MTGNAMDKITEGKEAICERPCSFPTPLPQQQTCRPQDLNPGGLLRTLEYYTSALRESAGAARSKQQEDLKGSCSSNVNGADGKLKLLLSVPLEDVRKDY